MTWIRHEREGSVLRLTVTGERTRNALDSEAMRGLDEALDPAAVADASVVILTGDGERSFISGGDLNELEAVRSEAAAADLARSFRRVLDRIPALPVPVVCVLNGDALGGGAEVAVACDWRIAIQGVRVAFLQAGLGVVPAWGGAERLVDLVGRSQALRLLTTSCPVATDEALRIGLVEQVVQRDGLAAALTDLATRLGEVPRDTLVAIKRMVSARAANAHPTLEDAAVHDFSLTWVAESHWDAVRRSRGQRAANQPHPPRNDE